MTDNWMADPDMQAWARNVSEQLVPLLRDSAVTVSLVPDKAGLDDVKMAVELGMSIMLGKPIVLVVFPGRQVPAKLIQVADEIVEVDEEMSDPASHQRLASAIERATGRTP